MFKILSNTFDVIYVGCTITLNFKINKFKINQYIGLYKHVQCFKCNFCKFPVAWLLFVLQGAVELSGKWSGLSGRHWKQLGAGRLSLQLRHRAGSGHVTTAMGQVHTKASCNRGCNIAKTL